MVSVKFGAHISGNASKIGVTYTSGDSTGQADPLLGQLLGYSNYSQLGLAVDNITVKPNFRHLPIKTADYGPEVHAETMVNLADAVVEMTLSHYDKTILDICMSESMGGAIISTPPASGDLVGQINSAGRLQPAGTTLGRNLPRLASGNHYIGLNIQSPQLNFPWRFLTAYLQAPPLEIPLGTAYSAVKLQWRAIPYSYQPFTVRVVPPRTTVGITSPPMYRYGGGMLTREDFIVNFHHTPESLGYFPIFVPSIITLSTTQQVVADVYEAQSIDLCVWDHLQDR